MARTTRPRAAARQPANVKEQRYQAHADEAKLEHEASLTDAEREEHNRAWSAHFTAVNTQKQVARNLFLANHFRRTAGWHFRQPPTRRQYDIHPKTKERVFLGDYLNEVADQYQAAANYAEQRAALHLERGVQHSIRAREIRAASLEPPKLAVAEEPKVPEDLSADRAVEDQPSDRKRK